MKVKALAFFLWMLVPPAFAGQEPVAFRAEAKVELDATGKPTRIEASKDLPEAIRGYIEKRVATWTFSPPARDGVTGAGVTYLSLGACAIPDEGGYRLGLDFKHNGPRITTANGRLPNLPYPLAALRSGRSKVEMDVHFFIEEDGRATLDRIAYQDGSKGHRGDGFDATVRDWVGRMRFEPEQLAGKPLRSKADVHLLFTLGDRKGMNEVKRDLLDTALTSKECRMAAGEPDGLMPVVLDSPIKVLKAI